MQSFRRIVFLALALLLHGTNAFMMPSVNVLQRSIQLRSSSSMQMNVNLLERIETLKVLTALSKTGLLSKVEKSGLLSKLEKEVSKYVY
jgi:hypothetical protein